MDELTVIWTQTALNQRDAIFNYWNKRNKSKSYSRKLNLAIRERTRILKAQPEIGKTTAVENVKSISMRHYSIFYAIKDSFIFIVSFWDNRQSPEKLLKILNSK